MVLFVPRLGPTKHDGIVGVQGGGSHHTPRAQVASLLPDSQREHEVTILRGSAGRMRNIKEYRMSLWILNGSVSSGVFHLEEEITDTADG